MEMRVYTGSVWFMSSQDIKGMYGKVWMEPEKSPSETTALKARRSVQVPCHRGRGQRTVAKCICELVTPELDMGGSIGEYTWDTSKFSRSSPISPPSKPLRKHGMSRSSYGNR